MIENVEVVFRWKNGAFVVLPTAYMRDLTDQIRQHGYPETVSLRDSAEKEFEVKYLRHGVINNSLSLP